MPEDWLGFDQFLAHLREQSRNTRDQGTQFEVAMAALLPHLPDHQFEDAWLWKDWPQRQAVTGLNAQDIGIDIVARVRDSNEYWAVQCKFYDPDSTVTHGDLGTFFTASGREGFSGRLIITTTDRWTSHARDHAGKPADRNTPSAAQGSAGPEHRLELGASRQDQNLQDRHKELYPRQKDAFEAARAHFAVHDRGQLIMACGTGKTFTSLKIAEELTPEDGHVLFVVPSLSLMKQTISEWAWERATRSSLFRDLFGQHCWQ